MALEVLAEKGWLLRSCATEGNTLGEWAEHPLRSRASCRRDRGTLIGEVGVPGLLGQPGDKTAVNASSCVLTGATSSPQRLESRCESVYISSLC